MNKFFMKMFLKSYCLLVAEKLTSKYLTNVKTKKQKKLIEAICIYFDIEDINKYSNTEVLAEILLKNIKI